MRCLRYGSAGERGLIMVIHRRDRHGERCQYQHDGHGGSRGKSSRAGASSRTSQHSPARAQLREILSNIRSPSLVSDVISHKTRGRGVFNAGTVTQDPRASLGPSGGRLERQDAGHIGLFSMTSSWRMLAATGRFSGSDCCCCCSCSPLPLPRLPWRRVRPATGPNLVGMSRLRAPRPMPPALRHPISPL